MKKILKIAGVLLIAVAMVMSTVAVTADTVNENAVCLTSEPTNIVQPGIETFGRAILWDQYDTDGSNGLSHSDPTSSVAFRRDLLDDFEIPAGETWVLEDLHSLNLWNTMQPGVGTDFVLSFWSDNGGSPGAPIANAVTVSYTETATGRTWFTRPEFEIEYVYEPITLTEGIYWICGHVVGPENCFWMARETIWGSECWTDYADMPPMGPGSVIFGSPFDLAFQLTGEIEQPCEPSIDVEKYVWDPENEEWVDADTEADALDLPICTDARFKIVIKNTGDCPLAVGVLDTMHDSLKYVSADPEPEEVTYDPPYYYIIWVWPEYVPPGETVEIIVTAHVEGPECSTDENHVLVEGECLHGELVEDEDSAFVHAYEKARTVSRPFLNFLQQHPNLFPILRLLLQRLGL